MSKNRKNDIKALEEMMEDFPSPAINEDGESAGEESMDGGQLASGDVSGDEVAASALSGGTGQYFQEDFQDEAQTGEIPEEEARQQLSEELDQLIERIKASNPEYVPPPFSPQRLVGLITRNLERFSPAMGLSILEQLRDSISSDLLDIDTWKGVWYMINYSLEYQGDMLKRRISGEYDTDEWGLDPEVLDLFRPFFRFLYDKYWRVETTGLENIPDEGRTLLVVNHSGQLPWDGSMVATAVMNYHPSQRLVRTLYATWFPTLPFFSEFLTKMGQVLANEENGVRLLEQDELIAVFPEGYKGVGKLFKERYRLARFGRGGFVRMALRAQAPLIPVSVVGAEETYISLAKSPTVAKMIGFPYFPISPTFPWFGLLGFVPLPTKWYIDFGEPFPMDGYGPDAANNVMLVSQLTDQVRNIIQNMIYTRLAERKSVFFG
jgi:1-acyl-sn-glycerol-3-phosphate acyltransferase